MAMTLGEATVESDGSVTKSGVIGRYYDEIYGSLTVTLPSGNAAIPFLRQIAAQATAQGTAMYITLTTQAKARIAPGEAGLQRLPDPPVANALTQGPGGDGKYLPIV